MKDERILTLLLERSEEALRALEERYGRMLYAIAFRILGDAQDAEECVNDALLTVWSTVPPEEPEAIGAYAGRVVRNVALNRWQRNTAAKRRGGTTVLLDELAECLPDPSWDPDEGLAYRELVAHINGYLRTLDERRQVLFARRYWYGEPVEEIARSLGMSRRAADVALCRVRQGLRAYLTEKGVSI